MTMSEHRDTRSRGTPKRAGNACERCRRRKIKCSESVPCSNCLRKGVQCNYEDPDNRKVVVSRRYLQRLEQRGRYNASPSEVHDLSEIRGSSPTVATSRDEDVPTHELGRQSGGPTSAGLAEGDDELTGEDTGLSNPIASATSTYLADSNQRLRALGESSTWSFTHRTLVFLSSHLNHPEAPVLTLNEGGAAYRIKVPMASSDAVNVDNLPSVDYAIFLINSVSFHIGQLFHLFHETKFMVHVHEFYHNPQHKAETDRVWYIHFLVILALGKAITVQTKPQTHAPPGCDLFKKAMAFMPDSATLFGDVLTSIELLCGVSLYLQFVDMRLETYVYIGQALRMALSYALHRERPPNQWDNRTADRCEKVWWTVYILDRAFSSSMGTPVSIQDEDITTALPQLGSSNKSTSLNIYVQLSRVMGHVQKEVYGANGRLDAKFLPSTCKVIREIATVAEKLEEYFPLALEGPAGSISRVSAHLNLCYHQSILVAIYPLLLCLFQQRITREEDNMSSQRRFSKTVRALLQACADSANKMLRILLLLKQSNLLEHALTFDLEYIFSAAFTQSMMAVVYPAAVKDSNHTIVSYEILEEMIHRGSIPATYRLSELSTLEKLIGIWQEQRPGTNAEAQLVREGERAYTENPAPGTVTETRFNPDFVNTNVPGQVDSMSGLYPEHLFHLAQMMDASDETLAYSESDWMEALLWQSDSHPSLP